MNATAAIGHMPFPGHRTLARVFVDNSKIRGVPPKRDKQWCAQCETRVTQVCATACPLPWCKAKALAA